MGTLRSPIPLPMHSASVNISANMDSASLDSRFQIAVAAIDAGDIATLERVIAETPALVRDRLDEPGFWLRDVVGTALDGFFHEPYLLWFVAEDPVRHGR